MLQAPVDGVGGAVGGTGAVDSGPGVSEALSVRVLARAWISFSPSGMARFRESMSRCIRYFPRLGSSVR